MQKVTKGHDELRAELEAIAGDELADVLDVWKAGGELTPGQAGRLARYLRAELAPFGLLSTEHELEAGASSLVAERRQARSILRELEGWRGVAEFEARP